MGIFCFDVAFKQCSLLQNGSCFGFDFREFDVFIEHIFPY
jgi:hypothetical protein